MTCDFYVLFKSVSVISGRWEVDNERLYATEVFSGTCVGNKDQFSVQIEDRLKRKLVGPSYDNCCQGRRRLGRLKPPKRLTSTSCTYFRQ